MSSNQLAAFNYGVPPYANLPIKSVTAAYLVQPSDNGWIINCSSDTFTVALPAARTLPVGFNCWIWNTGDGTITIDPAGSETIDGTGTTYILRPRAGVQIVCNGTSWITGDVKAYRLYQESSPNDPNYTRPVASGFGAVAIGRSAVSSGSGSASFGTSAQATGAGAVAIGFTSASGADSIAICGSQGLGLAQASQSNAIAIGVGNSATSTNSTAIGCNSSSQGSQAVTGSGAMALGGSYASGSNSFAAAVGNNSAAYGAQGGNSVAIGLRAVATDTSSLSMLNDSQSRSSYSVAIGWIATASSTSFKALALGSEAQATRTYSTAIGPSISNIRGKYTYTGVYFASYGDVQTGQSILCCATTDATATVLTTNNSTASTDNQVILPNNSAYAFTGIVVARRQASGGTASAAWKIEGLIRREGAANTTTLVASTVTAISNVPGWTLALSADTTNGGLKVEATGAASTNIRWVATVQTSEVTYA